jgi:hypothetical protein
MDEELKSWRVENVGGRRGRSATVGGNSDKYKVKQAKISQYKVKQAKEISKGMKGTDPDIPLNVADFRRSAWRAEPRLEPTSTPPCLRHAALPGSSRRGLIHLISKSENPRRRLLYR